MALLRALGDLLDGSGWTSALVQAEIATAETSNSFLKAVRVKKNCSCSPDYSLRSVQSSAGIICWVQTCQPECNAPSFDESRTPWCEQRAAQSAQFHFWQLVLSTELDVLAWERSIYEGNFLLHVEALTRLQWLFDSLDHYNCALAIAVHLRDMVMLRDRLKHPGIFAEFCNGNFTVLTRHSDHFVSHDF